MRAYFTRFWDFSSSQHVNKIAIEYCEYELGGWGNKKHLMKSVNNFFFSISPKLLLPRCCSFGYLLSFAGEISCENVKEFT